MEWTILFEASQLFETEVIVFKGAEGLIQNIEKLIVYKETEIK